MLDDKDLSYALRNIDYLDPGQKARVLDLLEERERLKNLEQAREHFIPFVKAVWPAFIPGAHHVLMGEAFERIAASTSKRLIINMAPRHSKSELASVMLPAWFLGKRPRKKIIQTSNTEGLAAGFGRRVRNLIGGEVTESDEGTPLTSYAEIFPNIKLAQDSKAAAGWHTNYGGEYFAIGVNGRVTGKGADLAIIDDPHSEQEAKQAEYSPAIFDSVYDWYTSGIRQRLQPGGAIVIVMCMTGDTPVLRPDGSETPLRDIRPGDTVATYDAGHLSTARVANWQSNGIDTVYTIQTQSGRLLHANARHPFLVELNGDRRWTRLQNLTPGMRLVALKDVGDRPELKPVPCATHARLEQRIIENIPRPLTNLWGRMVNGKECCVRNVEMRRSILAECAKYAIGNNTFPRHKLLRSGALNALKAAMGSLIYSTMLWSKNAGGDAIYAESYLTTKTPARIGTANFASTTITTAKERSWLEGCCATIATSQLGMGKPPRPFYELLSTFDVTTDEIVSITPAGREEVFDVEIEGTENFIANGVVSHNTRWSRRDLTGRLIEKMQQRAANDSGDVWEVIELPALLDEGLETERPMWPGFWSLKELRDTREEIGPLKFKAQYQQQPTSEQSAILKRDYWRTWGKDTQVDLDAGHSSCPGPQHAAAWQNGDPPACDYILQSWDCAATKNDRSHPSAMTLWGVFKAEDPTTGKTVSNIILLSAFQKRMEFPELKKTAKQFYEEDAPDSLLIENKSAGMQLIQEFRSMGIPAEDFAGSSRGTRALPNDKIARANLIADIFASGYVWKPDRRFAEEVVMQCADFPNGLADDLVDSTVQALLRFRAGGFIRTENDEAEDEDAPRFRRKRYY